MLNLFFPEKTTVIVGLEVPLDEHDRVEPIIRETMESVTELLVPLAVDIGFGPNWAMAK